MGKNDAVKELLTDEEIAALEDDEGGADPNSSGDDDGDDVDDDAASDAAEAAAAAAKDDGKADEDGDPAPDEGENAQEPVAGKDQPVAAEQQPKADPVADPTDGKQDTHPGGDDDIAMSVPQANWLLPENPKNKIDAIEANLDELAKKFDDGELTGTEFRQQSRQLERERDDLRFAQERARAKEETAMEGWHEACDTFVAKNAAFEKAGPLRSMLDSEVRRIQDHLISQGRNYLHPSILERAADNVRKSAAELLGVQIEVKNADGTPHKAAAPAAKEPAPKAKPRTEPPVPALSAVPVAADEGIEGGEFAYLDRLAERDPIAFEKALETMQKKEPEKAEAYLAYIS